jgi:hypothetical protein
MTDSSPTHGILNRYVASTPSFFRVVNVLVKNHVSKIKRCIHQSVALSYPWFLVTHDPSLGVRPHSRAGKGIYIFRDAIYI